MSMKDVPLDKRIAAAIFAKQNEQFEVLAEIRKATTEEMPEEAAYFWELVDLFQKTIEEKPKEKE